MDNHLNRIFYKTVFEDLPESTQYITFELSNYLFAIPSYEVLKVIATPPSDEGGLVELGLVQLGPYTIQTIDLPTLLCLKSAGDKDHPWPSASSFRLLENRKRPEDSQTKLDLPFLVVLQSASGDLLGIALREPPDLIEIPNYALKPVPSQKRLTRSLRWVSHVTSYELNGDRQSLLILDLSPILSLQQ